MAVGSRDRVDHLYAEAVAVAERFQDVDVTSALAAEAVIITDQQFSKSKAPAQYELDKVFCGVRRKPRCEGNHREVVDSRLGKNFLFLIMGREQEWSGGEVDYLERMRLEGDEDAGNVESARPLYQALDDIAMPAMHTVESTDGDHRSTNVWRQPGFVGQVDVPRHQRRLATQ
jgi:hypothetical protein